MTTLFEVDLPADLDRFQLPRAVAERLQHLLDRQDAGHPLTPAESDEARGLVDLAEFMSLLKLRSKRVGP